MPRRIPSFPDSFHSWNSLSSIGSGITFLSFGLIFFHLLSLVTLSHTVRFGPRHEVPKKPSDEVSGGPLPSYFGRREPGPRAATSSSTRLSFSSFIPWLVPLACGASGVSGERSGAGKVEPTGVWVGDRQGTNRLIPWSSVTRFSIILSTPLPSPFSFSSCPEGLATEGRR